MNRFGHKTCGAQGCARTAVIRVQPCRKSTWDFFCAQCWIKLALNTVQEAHDAGYLVVDKQTPPGAQLTLVDDTTPPLV